MFSLNNGSVKKGFGRLGVKKQGSELKEEVPCVKTQKLGSVDQRSQIWNVPDKTTKYRGGGVWLSADNSF